MAPTRVIVITLVGFTLLSLAPAQSRRPKTKPTVVSNPAQNPRGFNRRMVFSLVLMYENGHTSSQYAYPSSIQSCLSKST